MDLIGSIVGAIASAFFSLLAKLAISEEQRREAEKRGRAEVELEGERRAHEGLNQAIEEANEATRRHKEHPDDDAAFDQEFRRD